MSGSSHRVYFVDTSYLLELFAVPGFFDPIAMAAIRLRFKAAWARGDRLFVPFGCLLEFGNHVADIKNPTDRAKWAQLLHGVVVEAFDDHLKFRRFVFVDAPPLADVPAFVADWMARHISAPRGLVDAATAEKASIFKRERAVGTPVHIWTRDRRLKGVEPDPEPDPFL